MSDDKGRETWPGRSKVKAAVSAAAREAVEVDPADDHMSEVEAAKYGDGHWSATRWYSAAEFDAREVGDE